MLKVARLDVISSGARRRWSLDEKQRIVAESYAAPRQVSATARRNGLSASQLFTWRRLARDGRLVARQSGWEHSDNQDGHFGGRGERMIVATRR